MAVRLRMGEPVWRLDSENWNVNDKIMAGKTCHWEIPARILGSGSEAGNGG
jgi:hypothetical protein